jgi:hypothetical protein
MEIKHKIGDTITFTVDKKIKIERVEGIELSKGDIVYVTSLKSRVRSVELTEVK